MSMKALRTRTINWRFVAAFLTKPQVACGEKAGDGMKNLGWYAQDESPRCGLAPQRKSALRSFRCRVAGRVCETHSAVNIRSEFEKCKPRGTTVLTTHRHSPALGRSQEGWGETVLPDATNQASRASTRRNGQAGSGWLYWGYFARRGSTRQWRRRQLQGTGIAEEKEMAPQTERSYVKKSENLGGRVFSTLLTGQGISDDCEQRLIADLLGPASARVDCATARTPVRLSTVTEHDGMPAYLTAADTVVNTRTAAQPCVGASPFLASRS
jgi:hypothetical protein